MNAVEIEQAISGLAEGPFDAEAFPYQFLESFGAKAATIKRLRSGNTNKDLFTATVEQMSDRGSSNTHEIITYAGESNPCS